MTYQPRRRHLLALAAAGLLMGLMGLQSTRSWAEFFSQEVSALGATVLPHWVYTRPADANTQTALLEQALAQKPDALVFVASASDTAAWAQLLRRLLALNPAPGLLAAEWASTEQLIVRGGRAVEGMVVSQYFNRDSRAPAYLAFAQRMQQRFGDEPGFAEVAAYDAMHELLQALTQQRPGEALHQTLLRVRAFAGLEHPIRFDDYGDHPRPHVITDVHQGRFRVLQA